MPKSKFIRMASALLMILALVLPVATITPALAATGVSGTVVGADNVPGTSVGTAGVAGITVALVRNSDASIIGATQSGLGGAFTIAGFTDQSGAFTLVFLDERGCGASTAGVLAGLAGGAAVGACAAGQTGSAAAAT